MHRGGARAHSRSPGGSGGVSASHASVGVLEPRSRDSVRGCVHRCCARCAGVAVRPLLAPCACAARSCRRPVACFALVATLVAAWTGIWWGVWYAEVTLHVPYLTRPLWDSPERPWNPVIPNFGYRGPHSCAWYGWRARGSQAGVAPGGVAATGGDGVTGGGAAGRGSSAGDPQDPGHVPGGRVRDATPRVFDVFLFNHELDMLEIRLHELEHLVHRFVILESRRTFTGLPKPLHYQAAANSSRFARFRHQIHHVVLSDTAFERAKAKAKREGTFMGQSDASGAGSGATEPRQSHLRSQFKNAFDYEVEHRGSVMLRAVYAAGAKAGDVVLVSDVDEIPARDTVALLKGCDGWPAVLHLDLAVYRYSFTMPILDRQRRSTARTLSSDIRVQHLSHSRQSDALLANAGWHCTFCFPLLADFVAKVRSYSHYDRARHAHHLDPEHIQRAVCAGTDLYGMLPEAYTFRDLVEAAGPARRQEWVNDLPALLHDHPDEPRFRYLLPWPGSCVRPDYTGPELDVK